MLLGFTVLAGANGFVSPRRLSTYASFAWHEPQKGAVQSRLACAQRIVEEGTIIGFRVSGFRVFRVFRV